MKIRQKGGFFEKFNSKLTQEKIMKEIAIVGLAWYKKGFSQGGGQTDAGRWKTRANNVDPNRAILVKSGDLRRSLNVSKLTNISVTFSSLILGGKYDYAAKHNYGIGVPKREFLGKSRLLDKKNIKIIEEILKKDLENGG